MANSLNSRHITVTFLIQFFLSLFNHSRQTKLKGLVAFYFLRKTLERKQRKFADLISGLSQKTLMPGANSWQLLQLTLNLIGSTDDNY
jgi:hypothetical protein